MKRKITLITSFLMLIQLSFAQVSNYSVGQTVGDFTVTDVHGNTHNLSAIAASGKWIILDFFFVACGPCQATVPFFSELHQKYGCNEGDIFCISIDNGDSDAEVLSFESTYSESSGHSPAPAVSGTEGGGDAVVTDFGIGAYPTYCLIAPDMTLKNADIWPVSSIVEFESAMTNTGFSPTAMNCSGISSLDKLSLAEIKLFPNPSNGNVTVSINSIDANYATIEVSNLLGQVVYTTNNDLILGNNDIQLDLAYLEAGQYVVRISNETGSSTSSVQIK